MIKGPGGGGVRVHAGRRWPPAVLSVSFELILRDERHRPAEKLG